MYRIFAYVGVMFGANVGRYSSTMAQTRVVVFCRYSSHDLYLAGESYAGVYAAWYLLAKFATWMGGLGLKLQMVHSNLLGKTIGKLSLQRFHGILWDIPFDHLLHS